MTLSGLTQSGGSTAVVAFSAATTGPNATKNMIVVAGAAATTAGQIIGPWATTGTGAAAQTDYAVYDGSGHVMPANVTATSNDGNWTNSAYAYTLNAGTTLSKADTITALRYTGSAGTLALGTNNLLTYGLLNGGTGALTVTGAGGVLTTPNGGGNLFVTTGNSDITISASITNSLDSLPVTLVKSGNGTLTLSGVNGYSGGTVLNAGQVNITADNQLGNSSGGISFNGSAILQAGASVTLASGRTITLDNGALATLSVPDAYTMTISGKITGNGGIQAVETYSIRGGNLTFNSPASDFTGPVIVGGTSGSPGGTTLNLAGLVDGAGYGNITFASAPTFNYTGSGVVLSNRRIELACTDSIACAFDNNGSGAITVNSDLLVIGNGAKTLTLAGTYAGQQYVCRRHRQRKQFGARRLDDSLDDTGSFRQQHLHRCDPALQHGKSQLDQELWRRR